MVCLDGKDEANVIFNEAVRSSVVPVTSLLVCAVPVRGSTNKHVSTACHSSLLLFRC